MNKSLLIGDHLLQIEDINVRNMNSEQVALILRQFILLSLNNHNKYIKLIIARPIHNKQSQKENVTLNDDKELNELNKKLNIIKTNILLNVNENSIKLLLNNFQLNKQDNVENTNEMDDKIDAEEKEEVPIDRPILSKIKKSLSLEFNNLSFWSNTIEYIKLIKSNNGFGFSLIDFKDKLNKHVSFVIRSIVPNGIAHLDGRLLPGYRLISINDINLDSYSMNINLEFVNNMLKQKASGEQVTLGMYQLVKLISQLSQIKGVTT